MEYPKSFQRKIFAGQLSRTELNLRNNSLGDCAKLVALEIQNNQQALTSLNLSDNQFGIWGAQHVAWAIKGHVGTAVVMLRVVCYALCVTRCVLRVV